jgi:predicted enzyme related to lactoylglutathione lyase
MLGKISHILVYVSNLKESVAFYRDILKLDPVYPDMEPISFYPFDLHGMILALEPCGWSDNGQHKEKDRNPVVVQFEAKTFEELTNTTQHLKDHGVRIIEDCQKYDFGTLTAFADIDGNRLELLFEGR